MAMMSSPAISVSITTGRRADPVVDGVGVAV
jgi:hypothetical protein